jgi:hypothetical protein
MEIPRNKYFSMMNSMLNFSQVCTQVSIVKEPLMTASDGEKNLDEVIKQPARAMNSLHYLGEQTLPFQPDDHRNDSFEKLEKDRLAMEREAKVKAFFEMIAGEHAAGNFSLF